MGKLGLLALALLAPLVGCDMDIATQTETDQLRREIQTLQHELESERQRGVDRSAKITALEQASVNSRQWAYLDPAGGTGYSLVNGGLAPVLLSFTGSEPVGDGTRIRFQVGNMTSATFSGMKLTIRYNTRPPQNGDGFEQWQEKTRTAEVTLTDQIRPGAWNSVVASLPGLKPDELGHLALKPELDVLSLRVTP